MLNQTFCISTKIDTHRATKFYSWKNEHFHLWFIFSWQGGWFKKEKQNKTKPNIKRKQKLNHVSIKARQKKKKRELHSWQRLRWGEKNKQKYFSSMSRTHSAFSRKGSQPKSAGWYFLFSLHVYRVPLQNGKSWQHLSQWAHGFTLQPDLLILYFSTMGIPCSCLDAVDLGKVTVRKTKSFNTGSTWK